MDEHPQARTPALDDEAARREEARRYVEKLRNFYQLLLLAVVMIGLSALIDAWTSPGRQWFHWVAFGFGIAIVFSAIDTFGRNLWLGYGWQRRKEREYLARNRD